MTVLVIHLSNVDISMILAQEICRGHSTDSVVVFGLEDVYSTCVTCITYIVIVKLGTIFFVLMKRYMMLVCRIIIIVYSAFLWVGRMLTT